MSLFSVAVQVARWTGYALAPRFAQTISSSTSFSDIYCGAGYQGCFGLFKQVATVVYFPRMIKPGTIRDELVLNVDLAPSMLDVAGLPIPSYMQGKYFKPLLEGRKTSWRQDFLYHYHLEIDLSKMNAEEKAAFDKRWRGQGLDPSPLLVPESLAVRTKEWKYITYPGANETDELYNLVNDPYEMKNLISDPKRSDVVKKMKARLAQLIEETK